MLSDYWLNMMEIVSPGATGVLMMAMMMAMIMMKVLRNKSFWISNNTQIIMTLISSQIVLRIDPLRSYLGWN